MLSGVWRLEKWCLFSRCFSLLSLKAPKTTLVVLLRFVLFLKKSGFSSWGYCSLSFAPHITFLPSLEADWIPLCSTFLKWGHNINSRGRDLIWVCSNIAMNHWHFLRQMFPIEYCRRCSMPARISTCLLSLCRQLGQLEWWKVAKFENLSQGGKQECFWGRLGINSVKGSSCIVELAIDTLGVALLFIKSIPVLFDSAIFWVPGAKWIETRP